MNGILSPILDAELPPSACVGTTSAPVVEHDETVTFADILRGVPPQVFQRGDQIEGAYFLSVVAGFVQARRNLADGTKVGLGIYGPGEYLFGNEHIVVLQADSIIQAWTRDQFDNAVCRRPGGLGVVAAFLAERLGVAVERGVVFAIPSIHIKQRLALVLLDLATRIGVRNPTGSYTLPALTHEELCFEVGAQREIVSSTMNAFRKFPDNASTERAVYYDRKAITIYPAKLRKAAGLPEVEEEKHA